jgi:hypothetical protein
MAVYSPTKEGYYWVVSADDLSSDPIIADLFMEENYGVNPNKLVWGIVMWECPCSYSDYVALHPEPIQKPSL